MDLLTIAMKDKQYQFYIANQKEVLSPLSFPEFLLNLTDNLIVSGKNGMIVISDIALENIQVYRSDSIYLPFSKAYGHDCFKGKDGKCFLTGRSSIRSPQTSPLRCLHCTDFETYWKITFKNSDLVCRYIGQGYYLLDSFLPRMNTYLLIDAVNMSALQFKIYAASWDIFWVKNCWLHYPWIYIIGLLTTHTDKHLGCIIYYNIETDEVLVYAHPKFYFDHLVVLNAFARDLMMFDIERGTVVLYRLPAPNESQAISYTVFRKALDQCALKLFYTLYQLKLWHIELATSMDKSNLLFRIYNKNFCYAFSIFQGKFKFAADKLLARSPLFQLDISVQDELDDCFIQKGVECELQNQQVDLGIAELQRFDLKDSDLCSIAVREI